MNAEEPDLDTSVFLHEDSCWVYDPDSLMPGSGVEGVLAMMYRGGSLFYLDGESRRWHNVETKTGPKR